MISLNYEGKTALVTGASRGIGLAIKQDLESCGAKVIFTDRTIVDFTDLKATRNWISEVIEVNPKIDVLINNAGINKIAEIGNDSSFEEYESLMAVNVSAPFLISEAVSKLMVKHRYGRIVNISSIFGVITKAKRLNYSITKNALLGMTKTYGIELAKHNILTNAVSPGFTKTDLTKNILGEQGMKELESNIPIGKLADTTDISKVVLFLASEVNSYITSQNIIVDGGFCNV